MKAAIRTDKTMFPNIYTIFALTEIGDIYMRSYRTRKKAAEWLESEGWTVASE